MDENQGTPIDPPLHEAAPDYPICPDCEKPFEPGHQCREMMIDHAIRMRSAFQIAITALGKIRNMLIVWRRGEESKRLHEVSAVARKALGEIQELLDFGEIKDGSR